MLEPSDSQEAYDFTLAAFELSERWQLPVLLRMTTRVCHAKTIVPRARAASPAKAPAFERDIAGRVMIPAYARPAHRRLREKLDGDRRRGPRRRRSTCACDGDRKLGIVTAGRHRAPRARGRARARASSS